MIFRCLSDAPIHPRIANPFDIEARDLDVVRRILADWLGADIAERVTVTPVMDGEAVYEDAKHGE